MRYVCFFLFFFCSCSLKQQKGGLSVENEILIDKMATVSLKGESILSSSPVLGTNFVAKVDDYIIMQSAHNEPAFLVYQLENDKLREVGGFLRLGEGPFEMLQPYSFYDKGMNKLFLYDFVGVLKSIFVIDLNDISNLYDTSTWKCFSPPNTKSFYMGCSMIALNDTTVLTLGSHFNSKNLFSKIDLPKSVAKEVGYTFPLQDGTFNMESIVKQGVYMDATIAKHPYLSKFVYACGSGKYADILSFSDSIVKERISLFDVYPKYSTKDGANRSYAEDCLRGMRVRVTENGIYVLLMPLTKGEFRKNSLYKEYPIYCNDELFVFDWDGNLKKRYLLDIPVYSYLIDNNDRCLYGVSVDLNSEDLILKRYSLNEGTDDAKF